MSAPFVLRAAMGALRSSGPHHSGSYHPIFAQMPGLIVCLPSNAADAKGLMKTALRASDPVVFLEPKALYASRCEVPEDEHYVPFGVARIARAGRDITIVATGQQVAQAELAAATLSAEGIEAEIIDPRTIMPFDIDTVIDSIRRTHRLLVVDEAWAMCGLGGEIAQAVNELAFDELDAPPGRLHSEPVSHPFAPVLEQAMVINPDRIAQAARDVTAGRPPIPRHWLSQSRGRPAPVAPVVTAVAQAAAKPAAVAPSGDEPILMPFGDLTVSQGTLIRWAKAKGDRVREGELVAEIETDKAVVEIEAPASGILHSVEAQVGQVIAMGARIGGIAR
jgi:2-oxoisovalerate dehydrogenase E1 component